jgi:sodium/bile acid cotransporter 7
MLQFLRHRWFLFALILVLAGGMMGWELAKPLVERMPRYAIVFGVMFLMALPMETGAMWRAIRRPGPVWLAVLINLGLAPPLGWLAGRLLPDELATGLAIAMVVPCTLVAATVWTRRAAGNDAVAILVTMITNLGCFLVIPTWLHVFFGDSTSWPDLNFGQMVGQLAQLVVAPIVSAQLLRQWPPLAAWTVRHKTALSTVAQVGILSFVFAGAVGCGEQLQSAAGEQVLSLRNVSLMIVLVIILHLLLFALGLSAARVVGLGRPDAIAVGIAGSQKTIMVGVHLALQFGSLAILPMIAYHAAQLIIDTLIADRLREHGPDARPMPQ